MAIRRAFGDGSYVRMRTVMANAIVAQMLPDGVVKGGSALVMRLGDRGSRFTRDLDTATASPPGEYAERLRDALADGWEGFTGTVEERPRAHPAGVPAEYVMAPFDVKLSYLGSPWCTVRLEVGYDEIGDAEASEASPSPGIAEAFASVGLPAPSPARLMAAPYQIAQKLHGLTAPGSDRVRDLVDLQLIVADAEPDWRAVRRTCERLFAYRGQQPWPPRLAKGEGWDGVYDANSRGLGVLPAVDCAVEWANRLIARIAGS